MSQVDLSERLSQQSKSYMKPLHEAAKNHLDGWGAGSASRLVGWGFQALTFSAFW